NRMCGSLARPPSQIESRPPRRMNQRGRSLDPFQVHGRRLPCTAVSRKLAGLAREQLKVARQFDEYGSGFAGGRDIVRPVDRRDNVFVLIYEEGGLGDAL